METPDFDEMNRDDLFLYVELILKDKGLWSLTETWRETAVKIEDKDPELAAMLHKAMDRWNEMN
jgi:hypothetical protein